MKGWNLIRKLYRSFKEKYPTRHPDGLEIPLKVNILIVGQIILLIISSIIFLDMNQHFNFSLQHLFFLVLVFGFSIYYRSISIHAGRDIVIYEISDFVIVSSIILFNNYFLMFLTAILYILSHFILGLRNLHQIVFNLSNITISGTAAYIFYHFLNGTFISSSNLHLIFSAYVLIVAFSILNNIQTYLVVSFMRGTDLIETIKELYVIGEEFYIVVVSASALTFILLIPNLYPIIFLLIFLLFSQQIQKQREIKRNHKAKIELTQLKYEKEIEEMRAQKLESLHTFAGRVAHDIRNYLTIMSGNFELLENKISKEDESEKIWMAIDNIREVIKQLSDFSSSIVLDKEEVELNSFLEELIKFLLPTAGIDYDYTRTYMDLPVSIDRIKMKQVLSNIIINAIEAVNPETGHISIKLETMIEDNSFYSLIVISDNGHGIEEENFDKIFTPFFTTKEEGTGLGISAANSVIRAHQGRISFTSVYGEGTTFVIQLPLTTAYPQKTTAD